MKRFSNNPILEPVPGHYWQNREVFNAAATYAGDKVHILYRAMGDDGVSRLGYASSSDGYSIDMRLPEPAFTPASSSEDLGCEDPRLTQMNGECLMTYTAYRSYPTNAYQVAITKISTEDLVSNDWNWGERWLPFDGILNKNAVIFPRKIDGRYVMYHRLEPYLCIAYSDDLKRWCDIKAVMQPRHDSWDCLKVGSTGPPIELNEGWLFLYHGVDYNYVYRLGALLIDKDNPENILYRSEKPILEPTEEYERFGKVPNVVFSCGNVMLDDKLLVYYGGADSVICGAEFDLGELLP
ncbi:MAG: glycosidase [Candidatus Thorarchaeota archaeon]|nr:MAG: glycosidase [Candidatus Thorarchaeota archaeon]